MMADAGGLMLPGVGSVLRGEREGRESASDRDRARESLLSEG